jgi:hypothetical protein
LILFKIPIKNVRAKIMFKTTSILIILSLVACNGTSKDTSTTEETVKIDSASWARSYVQQLEKSVTSNPELLELNKLENAYLSVAEQILSPWKKSLLKKDVQSFSKILSGNGLQWKSLEQTTKNNRDGISVKELTVQSGQDQTEAYLASFQKIEKASLLVRHIELPSQTTAVLELRYDVRGINTDGFRRNDRGELSISLTKDNGRWMISSMEVIHLERAENTRSPAFVDATSELGLDKLPIDDRKEAIRRGGYALAVSDFNNDGLSDMLVGNYGPVQLLKNTGNGFEDVTAAAGIQDEGVVKSAAFADLDNDGDRDIAILRFVVGSKDGRGDFIAYENKGDGTFIRKINVLPRRRSYDRAMPLTMGDFDNNGYLDIYIGFPGIRDFTSGISNRSRPDWLASQGIWFNQGAWNFNEATDGNTVVGANNVYAHAAVATDLNNDGHLDLLVVDDSGRINPVYKNLGNGHFVESAEEMQLTKGGLSMGLTTGDFDNDGDQDIMSTHITLTAGERLASSSEGILEKESKMGKVMKRMRDDYTSLQLFRNDGNGTFTDITQEAGLSWAGDAAAAGEWIDYNSDGLLDYYLPNGLWSNGEKEFDSLFFRAEVAAYGDAILGNIPDKLDTKDPMPNDVNGRAVFEGNGGPNPILTVLRNHRSGSKLSYSMAGDQANRLFRNNGDGSFTEVGYLENADRQEDGYIVAPVDINNDGIQDLVLRNTDPAPENSYPSVIALKNTLASNAVNISLQGTQSNRDGIGAMVTATIGEKTILREVRSVNGAVQTEPGAYIGLGSASQIDRLEIRWPSGITTVQTNISAGSLRIIEE